MERTLSSCNYTYPLYEKHTQKSHLYRAYACLHLLLLLSFLTCRLLYSLDGCYGLMCIITFCCELWFSLQWVLYHNMRWLTVEYKAYPERLACRCSGESTSNFPPVDVIITTADPFKEPAIITANTVLSVLALDYPIEKFACYVSDDGGSSIIFYSLVETLEFSKIWVPFCKKFHIQPRAPAMYFSKKPKSSDPNFLQQWQCMKDEYEILKRRIAEALDTGEVPLDSVSENVVNGFVYKSSDIRNHSSIVKVIHENKVGRGNEGDVLPHLIYVAREKRPKVNHHYKAGAMNVMILFKGMNGIQGPVYGGTCCFHRRKGLYGVPPSPPADEYYSKEKCIGFNGKEFQDEAIRIAFGESSALVASAQAIMRDNGCHKASSPSLVIEEALTVANCSYEANTAWGKEVGWMYGSTIEDVMTGLKVHSLGWHSIFYAPEKPAFIGCAPGNGPDSFVQYKRWATGSLEIFMSKSCPLLGKNRQLTLRQRMVYAYLTMPTISCVATLCYAILPAFSLLRGKSFLPKIQYPAFITAVGLFISVYGYSLSEYLRSGCSASEWWNNQRMWLIMNSSSNIFALYDVAMKLIGLSRTVFVVTPKGGDEEGKEGYFTFNSSPLFIPPTTVLLINLAALVQRTLLFEGGQNEHKHKPFAEYFCCVWVVINLWPFLKGLVRKGKFGLPWSVVIKSCALALIVCRACVY